MCHNRDGFDILNEITAAENLETEFIGKKCIFKEETGSTNDDAKALAAMGCENGTVVMCQKQTRGKGRLGREWSAPENGLYFSIVLKPDIMAFKAPQVTLMAGIAAADAIKRTAGQDVKIKWPNDIIINGKKAVGILSEMSAEAERVKYIVVGMGINVNERSFPREIAEKATSIFLESGRGTCRAEIYRAVAEEFELIYKRYIREGTFEFIRNRYKQLCITIGMRVSAGDTVGEAVDIDDDGALIIKKDDGQIISVSSGEVSVRREDGTYI